MADTSMVAGSWTPITPDDAKDLALRFRSIRFDVAGTVKMDVQKADGDRTTITRNVQAGETWPASSTAVLRIYANGTSATGIDGLG